MALQNKKAPVSELTFKTRGPNDKKRVIIYGNDGTGKSTFAEKYCKENGLKPICIDVDDTNYTSVPLVEIDTRSDITYRNVGIKSKWIKEVF